MLHTKLPGLRPAAVACTPVYQQYGCRSMSSVATGSTDGPSKGELGTSVSPFEPILLSHDDGMRTVRGRNHGNKPLPVPEIMDPIYLQARDKYKQPKQQQARPKNDSALQAFTAFQQELAMNPYANALATPIRQCALSRVRLPSHFLLSFGLFLPAVQNADQPEECEQATSVEPGKPFYRLIWPKTLSSRVGIIGQPSYVQANHVAIKTLTEKKGTKGKKGQHGKLANLTTKVAYAMLMKRAGEGSVHPVADWEWTAEMPRIVLKKRRETVLRALMNAFVCGLVKGITELEMVNVAAIVSVKGAELNEDPERKGKPRYDLAKLCEEAQVLQLVEKMGISEDAMVIVKSVKSVKVLLELEKLQNYIGG